MRIIGAFAVSCLVVLAACGGTSSPDAAPSTIDAPLVSIDAPAPDAAGTPDASARTCTGALYDPCTDPSQCASNNCMNFQGAMLEVCTQACDSTNNPCPDQGTTAVMCNNNHICRPTAANTCTP